MRRRITRLAATGGTTLIALPTSLALLTACGSQGDDRFAADTYDEYTSPLSSDAQGPIIDAPLIQPSAKSSSTAAKGSGSGGVAEAALGGRGGGTTNGSTASGSTTGSATGSATASSTATTGSATATTTGSGRGTTGVTTATGGGVPDSGIIGGPSGTWSFDDCSPTSPFLLDGTGNGANAQHATKASCVAGISGLAVNFRSKKDIVQIADEPQFQVAQHIAVAAWIHPNAVQADQPIVLKRLNNQTSFSLGIHAGSAEFSVILSSGTTVRSRAPVSAGVWTHVAGMYDGRFLRLFLNGELVGLILVEGTVRNVVAPIRVGATTQTQFFDGLIDEVWLSTNTVSPDEVAALSCVTRPFSVVVSPTAPATVPIDTPVDYSIAVTNNDIGTCPTSAYFLSIDRGGSGGGGITGGTSGSTVGGISGGTSGGVSGGGSGGGSGTVFDAGLRALVAAAVVDAGTTLLDAPPGSSDATIAVDGGSTGRSTGGISVTTGRDSNDGGIATAGSNGGSDGGVGVPTNDGLNVFVDNDFMFDIAPGTTTSFHVQVSGTDEADPGMHSLPFTLFEETRFDAHPPQSDALAFSLAEQTGCHVTTKRELMITSTSVVDDPVRTTFDAPVGDSRRGAWTFGRLMRDMAATPDQAPALALRLFQTWLTDQTVNGFTVAARPEIQQQVLDAWPRTASGELDLDRSPLRLLAIVNRVDLRDLDLGQAGEGRFVFGVLDPSGFPLQFTVIVEFRLPATTEMDVLNWAAAWHALGSLPFPSETYNVALEALTRKFSGRNVAPGRPNGSSLGQLRTNEIALEPRWELREFALGSDGFLHESPVKLTPDLSFNGTTQLADFINQNEAALLLQRHVVPPSFEGAPFLAGSVFNDLVAWVAPGVNNNEARHMLSLNTCNGCHGAPETNTFFLQISPRFPGSEAALSAFLTGTTTFDPVTGDPRTLNDLSRRRTDLNGLVCAPAVTSASTAPAKAAAASPTPATSIRKGISRTH